MGGWPRLAQVTCAREAVIVCNWLVRTHSDAGTTASFIGMALCIFLLSPVALAAADGIPDAAHLTEFIVNITRYTSWPGDAASKGLTVCYAHGGALLVSATSGLSASSAPIAPPLQTSTAPAGDTPREVRGLPLTWRNVNVPAQLPGCNVVWLHADLRPAMREWLSVLQDKPVLTLSNYADFAAEGGIIAAYRSAAEWRFEVNLELLQRSGLSMSAVALRLSQKARSSAAGTGTGEPR